MDASSLLSDRVYAKTWRNFTQNISEHDESARLEAARAIALAYEPGSSVPHGTGSKSLAPMPGTIQQQGVIHDNWKQTEVVDGRRTSGKAIDRFAITTLQPQDRKLATPSRPSTSAMATAQQASPILDIFKTPTNAEFPGSSGQTDRAISIASDDEPFAMRRDFEHEVLGMGKQDDNSAGKGKGKMIQSQSSRVFESNAPRFGSSGSRSRNDASAALRAAALSNGTSPAIGQPCPDKEEEDDLIDFSEL